MKLDWAWADVEQPDEDYRVTNALSAKDGRVWAVDAHHQPGGRVALFASTEPFGFAGGTRLRVTLGYESPHKEHSFGRVAISLAKISESFMGKLPETTSAWYIAGPWPTEVAENPYEVIRGPESSTIFNPNEKWAEYSWRYGPKVLRQKRLDLLKVLVANFFLARSFLRQPVNSNSLLGATTGLWSMSTE